MIDQDVARLWAENHAAFGRWVGKSAQGVRDTFRALHRIQYASPWETIAQGRARH